MVSVIFRDECGSVCVCVMNTGTANLQQESGLLIASVFFGLKSCRDSSRFS